MDLTVVPYVSFRDRFGLDLRGESSNTFNRANFNNPNATIGTSSAGIISSSGAARVLQLTAKINF